MSDFEKKIRRLLLTFFKRDSSFILFLSKVKNYYLKNSFLKNILLKNNLILMKYNKKYQKMVEEFFNKIKIIDSGYELVRIGKNGDGGYLIPNILNQVDYCFSPGVGIGDSSTFEDSLANYNICSFLADGTVDYVGKHNFIKKNLNCYNDKSNITLESWVNQKIQDQTNNKLILQMDIDGAEIEVLYEVKISLLNRFKCIVIEFHNFLDIITPLGLKIYSDVFNKILKTHHIVHIHPNNCSNVLVINKKKIANFLEITFINKEICKYVKKVEHELPHPLDQKCYVDWTDDKLPETFYK